jgi:hypothetical protein
MQEKGLINEHSLEVITRIADQAGMPRIDQSKVI